MTIATLKTEIKNLKNALNTPLDEKLKAKLREQLSKSEKTLAEMESAKTPTAKKNATKKANVVAKKSTSVLQKIKKANKKVEPKKATPKKATATKKPSVLQQLKSKINLTKNLSGYKKSGIDLVRDADRPALPMGRRISKDGNVYYENRLNRVDIKQPPKRYPKLEEGGMMAKGGYVVFNYTDNIHASNEVFKTKKEAKEFIENFRNRFNQQGYYRTNYGERIPTNQIDLEVIPEDFNPFKKMSDGGMMAKGGEIPFENSNLYLNGYGFDSNGNKVIKVSFPNDRAFSIQTNGVLKETNRLYTKNINELNESEKNTIEKEVVEYIKEFGSKHQKSKIKTYSGMMARGGFVSKGEMVWGKLSGSERMKFLNENFTPSITPRSQEILVDKTFVFLPKEVKIKLEEKFANVEPNEDGKYMAKGGRLKSAIMRDRAYKSNEPHEQAYTRKTRPKNPKYNYGFFADGGEIIMTDVYAKKDGKVVKVNERPMELKEAERFVKEQGIEKYYTDLDFKFINKDFGYAQGGMSEMHRAYAMGGVLQHGLETGDFIISHDEGKMVVMNGGSKYEVNIHSGSRTKID